MKKLILLLALSSCYQQSSYDNGYSNVTHYKTQIDRHTPLGIGVDDPTHLLVDEEIDLKVVEMQLCLRNLPSWDPKTDNVVLTNLEAEDGHCLNTEFQARVVPEWVQVKVAPDWHLSECTGQEVFSCEINSQVCDLKPELKGVSCPCSCRGTIQDNKTIITTPNMKLFKAELLRLISSCNNVWKGLIRACAI